MRIYIVEKEENTGEGFWQNGGITPCLTLEIAIREREKMMEESNEGEFVFSEDNLKATSKNGWVKFIICPYDVVSE